MSTLASIFLASAMLLAVTDNNTPIAKWEFGPEETEQLTVNGNIQRDQLGPRPPEFPDMDAKNTAVRIAAKSYLSISDTGPKSDFDFTNDDAITIEAWVNPTKIPNGQFKYIIGKGRTGSPKFSHDNQNWAIRLVGAKGEAKLSFLFATKLTDNKRDWHRWTSDIGFPVGTGWHHIAVSYRFGDPDSIRGWVNSIPTQGTWDLDGPTKEPPVVDDDEIRIGNRYEGILDSIKIYRTLFDDKVMASRFKRVGKRRIIQLQPEVMPELGELPKGRVTIQLYSGLPAHDRWLNEGEQWPKESFSWQEEQFLLPRIPIQYDSWGIRTRWNAPLLLRMAADVNLPAGKIKFLMRARSQGRLWVDGQLVTRTKPMTIKPPNGEEPVTPIAVPPLAGMRPHGYHQQEVFGETVIESDKEQATRRCRVVLELVVGGSDQRTETGEMCVAIQSPDGKMYSILDTDSNRLHLTDAKVEPVLQRIEKTLSIIDDRRRRKAAASQDKFWNQRHHIARNQAKQNSLQPAPQEEQTETTHPIDSFIAAKIDRAIKASQDADVKETELFHKKVLPILREQCFRCHGKKDKGGLRLDSREASLHGGDSEIPAIVPGDLETSELIARIRSTDEDLRMPPTEDGLNQVQVQLLEDWVQTGAAWPAPPLKKSEVTLAPLIDETKFLRRIYLDTVGVPPTVTEAQNYFKDQHPDKREQLINKLLDDDRYADHWVSFWLDLLAENPTLLNASLNSTGPFRWFLYDSLRDHKPLDRMVTELMMMRGGAHNGGSAGFGLAGENDAPFAAKGHIIASAFLGIELQCARCHDSPYHTTTQRDLYSLAAMLNRKPVTVPRTSRVPAAFFDKQVSRKSLIQVTLKPDEKVKPEWPFASTTGVEDNEELDQLMHDPQDPRERFAALITAPENKRFPRVIVNRIWKQLIGSGIVEPIQDWEGNHPSHPELLDWLSQQLIANDYDMRHVIKLIVSSHTYQRESIGKNLEAPEDLRFFNAPERRRLTAEQIVDSLHQAVGRPIDVEELTFVHDGRRPLSNRLTLGTPKRAWMFGDLKNERDRPSLSLPKARSVVDVLEAFGWTGARQMPISNRESDPNVLQPGILANGTLSATLSKASHNSEMAREAVNAKSPDSLVDKLFLRILTRAPKPEERISFSMALSENFSKRLVPEDEVIQPANLPQLPLVTWFNHGRPKANEIQLEMERRVLAGPQPDPRIRENWRILYEDVVWSLINNREFVWIP